jgi:malonyl CoA-acyl carrier protein transacylase/MFS family permease
VTRLAARAAAAAAWRERLGRRASRDAWIVLGGELVSSVGTGLTLPFLVVYLHRMRGFDPALAGLTVSALAAAGFVGNPLGGWAADRAGPRNTFFAGLVGAAAGSAWLVFVDTAWEALLAAVLLGLGGSVMFPARNALLATLVAPAQRSAIFSIQQMLRNAGFGAGAVASSAIVDLSSIRSFQLIYLADAATFVVFAAILALVADVRAETAEGEGDEGGYRAVLADARFVRLWIVMALLVVVGYAQFQAAFPIYATGSAQLGASVLSVAYAVNMFAVVLLQLVVLRLMAGRRRTRGLMVTCVFVAGAWATTLLAAPAGRSAAAALFILAMLLLAVGETLIAPTAPALVNDLAPERLRGRYNGAFTLVWTVGFVAGPALAGAAFEAGRTTLLFGGFIVGCGLAALVAADLERRLPDALNRIGERAGRERAVSPAGQERPWQLIALSARSEPELEATTRALEGCLEQEPTPTRLAAGLPAGRAAGPCRRIVVYRERSDAVAALRSLDSHRVATGRVRPTEARVVFMFPGGGAGYPGMAADVYAAEPAFRDEVDRCAELLSPQLDVDLRAVLYPGSDDPAGAAERIERPRYGLPSLFVTEYALARLWMSWGVEPGALIGHSLGEYVAACLAGVLSLEDALALVALRGRLLDTLPPGAMLSVNASEQEILPLLGEEVSLAAVNGPAQCVVAGPTAAVEELRHTLAACEINARLLHIAAAAHSELVRPILAEFRAFLDGVHLEPPAVPCISNVTGTWLGREAADTRYWVRHVQHTVRFADGVSEVMNDRRSVLLEVGPGHTLSTLARQNTPQPAEHVIISSLRHPYDPSPDGAILLAALGKLWIAGVDVDRRRTPTSRIRSFAESGARREASARPGRESREPIKL